MKCEDITVTLHFKVNFNGRRGATTLKVKVKVNTLDIAPLRSESPPQKRTGMARVWDGRLSRPWCEVAQAEIRTCNLPIANPALYHTATSAPSVRTLIMSR